SPRTRPRPLAAAAALLFALFPAAAGCGQVVHESEQAGAAERITVVDDADREVAIDGPVRRAVVLNSYANEFVQAIGAGDAVVGVDRVSLERLPYLGFTEDEVVSEDLSEINYEAVAELDPDVFIVPRNGAWQEAEKQLEPFGVPVVVATAWDFDVFHETVDLLGQVFGETEGAEEVSGFYDEIFDAVAQRVEGTEPVPVYWETEQPYLTVVPGSGFDRMITAAGGENVFGDVKTGGDEQAETTVDPAEVAQRDPEVIVHEFGPSADPTGPDCFEEVGGDLLDRPGWQDTPAVRD